MVNLQTIFRPLLKNQTLSYFYLLLHLHLHQKHCLNLLLLRLWMWHFPRMCLRHLLLFYCFLKTKLMRRRLVGLQRLLQQPRLLSKQETRLMVKEEVD